MAKITDLYALEVLDSRGNPTIEVGIILDDLISWRALVPSGASTGSHEALELRDGDPHRYLGKGVLKAIAHIEQVIRPALLWRSFTTIQELDSVLLTLDGTPNKSHLGANAILWVSMARCVSMAKLQKLPLYQFLGTGKTLPMPLINVLNGGAHASNALDVQECMLVPVGAETMAERLRRGAEVFHTLKKILHKAGYTTTVGDEGGFAPLLTVLPRALELLCDAIVQAGYTTTQIKLALDVASTELYTDGVYQFSKEGVVRTGEELVNRYAGLCDQFPLISIEDGLAEDDIASRQLAQQRLGSKVMLVGDDLFVTNPIRLQQGIDEQRANAILIKLNQIGTVSETLETILLAQQHGYTPIISHRSGETEDSFIADLAVATNAGWIKTWSVCRTDRTAKYNQLFRIEAYLKGMKTLF